jgi:hypothetical protein
MSPDGEEDVTSSLGEFFGYLAAGCPRPYDKHGASRQLTRVAVTAGVELHDIRRKIRRTRGNPRSLVRSGSDNDVARLDVSMVSGESITAGLRRRAKGQYVDAGSDGGPDLVGIALDELKNFFFRRKTVRVASGISAPG